MKINFIIIFMIFFVGCSSYRILGIFPFILNSHLSVFLPLMEELARRGHQVTVVSHKARSKPLTNYTDVSLSSTFQRKPLLENIEYFHGRSPSAYTGQCLLYNTSIIHERTLQMPKVQNLLKNKYDVLITQIFNNDILNGLLYRLNAPIIGISSFDILHWHSFTIGKPLETSYIPLPTSNRNFPMNLWDRCINALETWICIFLHTCWFIPQMQKLAEKHLGPLPKYAEIDQNFSLLLTNTHFSFHGPKPLGPNIIEIGGMHLGPRMNLPQDLREIMDNSKYGVIYFSFGSTISGDNLGEEKKNAFLKEFSKLNQTVLWKIKSHFNIPVPSNVITSSWFPQRDLLGHPNMVLFVSQCGILSVIEAVDAGVPMICIPLFGDQSYNSKILAFKKAGVVLDFTKITERTVGEALNTIILNPIYKENAKKISNEFNDRPTSPMDLAIYWIEYVVRHKGAPHIKSLAKDLTWYQYLNLDVFLIFIIILYLLFIVLKVVIVKLCFFLTKKYNFKSLLATEKLKKNQ